MPAPWGKGEVIRWMEQMARSLVDGADGFLVGKRYLLVDQILCARKHSAESWGRVG